MCQCIQFSQLIGDTQKNKNYLQIRNNNNNVYTIKICSMYKLCNKNEVRFTKPKYYLSGCESNLLMLATRLHFFLESWPVYQLAENERVWKRFSLRKIDLVGAHSGFVDPSDLYAVQIFNVTY